MSSVTELRQRASPSTEAGIAQASPEPRLISLSGWVRMSLLILAALAGVVVVGNWLVYRWTHVLIDDSRIAAHLVTVSSEVSGRVTDVPVIMGDTVKKGDLLIKIDRSQAELENKAIEAQIKSIESEIEQLRAQQAMTRTQIARKIDAGKAEVAAAEAAHASSRAVLDNARAHYERIRTLSSRHVVSDEQLDQAQAELSTAEQQERSAAARLAAAKANLAVVEAQQAEIEVLDRQIAALEARKSAQIAQRDRNQIEIEHGTILADFDGVIDNTFIDAGEYVSPGTRLLIYHDPSDIWVDANVKETDFRRLKLGAPARITVDAYPDIVFTGKVVRLGEAATSQFALLPSPNPSGNFTKITQRVPVRIAVEQKDGLLRPGMMVEVSIDVID